MSRYFILRDGEVIEEPDHVTWASWYEATYESVREVARTQTANAVISTRFHPISMGLNAEAPALLFETRVTGGWMDDQGDRFATIDEAKAGHDAWVEHVRTIEKENEIPPPGAGW
jgi:hypothetical protein